MNVQCISGVGIKMPSESLLLSSFTTCIMCLFTLLQLLDNLCNRQKCVSVFFLPDTYKFCPQPEGNFMMRGIGYMKCQPWVMWIFVNCAIHSLWVYLLFISQIIQVCH